MADHAPEADGGGGLSPRAAAHVEAFNLAVVSGDWRLFVERFAPDATMAFVGAPAGPFVGRAAIADAYEQQPPADTLIARGCSSDGDTDNVPFAWSSGGTGTMRLTWAGELVQKLVVTFDD